MSTTTPVPPTLSTGPATAPTTAPSPGITVVGARENNLCGVDLTLPKEQLTVFTGVSGSGKSSLVYGTIAAESQRQLNEAHDSFTRNRMAHLGVPDADRLANLTVTLAVDQRRFSANTRSTVGTATDLAPLLRLLFSRIGKPWSGYSPAFSFNDPSGMCPGCEGLGTVRRIDADALLDPARSLDEGAIRLRTFAPGSWRWKRYVHAGLFDRTMPVGSYTPEERRLLLHGEGVRLEKPDPEFPDAGVFEGVVPRITRSLLDAAKLNPRDREELERFVWRGPCAACEGKRLNPAALACRIGPHNIADLCGLTVAELGPVVSDIKDPRVAPVTTALLERLRGLEEVGLGYLSLDRASGTLSGGEAQRVRLVRHLGGALTGLTYVLDEPSAGLHPADVHRLTGLLRRLRDKGNTVLVVEHDPNVIAVADHVVDLGPGAGTEGGRVVYEGTVAGLSEADTPTGRYLRRPRAVKARPRTPNGAVEIRDARLHNLREINVRVPTGVLTAVTGVAGSGKSSLAHGELPRVRPDAVVLTQGALHGGPRSTPVTYLGIQDALRGLFARAHGVAPGWFSANSKGACPTCRGRGVIVTDLAFLDDVRTECEDCRGLRFNAKALSYTLAGLNIAEVLAMTAARARGFFGSAPAEDRGIAAALERLDRVGLGYLGLGRPLDTLSGGERQRLRLARELAASARLYVLDEPTSGLHGGDVAGLIALFERMVDEGATVVVVEHRMDVVAAADHVVDLGPGAGPEGGRVVFEGTPAELADSGVGATADALRAHLAG
ncbi:excinuclease ABC subunit UvrA [Nocardiopsis exhalans]|uniref:UvrABC system protein A n=1 Tax=Nocardiopsis exhalans TaxID=163604 RepID=A0ABY5DEY9_9ACTN|nr:excinuclease ABC subunit UvrA [Nocardiopsis exhalans]USY22921.1 excinuclease ABC subunit UvrA [Nocardiopsis exhalans]